MSSTFAFIGSRPDLGGLVARAHGPLLTVKADHPRSVAWGAGYFQSDELLLHRRPDERRRPIRLGDELGDVRTHALLAHVCDTKVGGLRTETTPPLRYGHLLFACQGPEAHHVNLRAPVEDALPDFLRSTLKGDTFTELAFSLFLAALPSVDRARSRNAADLDRVTPLTAEALRQGLRGALFTLDVLCAEHDVPRFEGDLWLLTTEHLVVAHRRGMLLLRVYRGRRDLLALGADEERMPSLEQTSFTAAVSGGEEHLPGWERLPDDHVLTASRSETPETQSL